jgi:hypothetical protein
MKIQMNLVVAVIYLLIGSAAFADDGSSKNKIVSTDPVTVSGYDCPSISVNLGIVSNDSFALGAKCKDRDTLNITEASSVKLILYRNTQQSFVHSTSTMTGLYRADECNATATLLNSALFKGDTKIIAKCTNDKSSDPGFWGVTDGTIDLETTVIFGD